VDRVFLDACVLFAAAYKARARLRRLWRLSGVKLLTSPYACREAQSNLLECDEQGRPKEPEPVRIEKLNRFIDLIRRMEIIDDPTDCSPLERIDLPAKDWPILRAALEGKATHLLTTDKTHFGPYFGKRLAGVLVLSPAEYLHQRGQPSNSTGE
jgi:predicted nucleic acid-binding protein